MKKIATGSAEAFQEVYRRHSPLVFGYAVKLSRDRIVAQDITQDVWIRVVRLAASYRGDGSLKGWLLSITRNTALTLFRKTKERGEDLTETEQKREDISPFDFESQILCRLELDELRARLDELPSSQKIALSLWMTEQLSYEEISQEMDLSLTAVKSLIFRARATLSSGQGARK